MPRLPRRSLAILVISEILLIGVVLVWKRLDVYRLGARAFFEQGDPYGPLPPTRNGIYLPFTYPPFAAAAFAPLLVVPLDAALIALTVISVVALGAVLALCFAPYEPRWVIPVVAVQAVALVSEPVRATLGFGQVNLLLMLLVAVDALAPMRRWPRGALVGLAAAVKLTPVAFILFFLLRRDFKAAARAITTFAGCAILAWLVAPSASAKYWTTLVFQGERIGDPGYIGNQSLRGLIARTGVGAPTLIWVIAVSLVLVATALVVRRAFAANQPVLALLACALGALLMSPVSWTHHWVWAGPVIGVLCLSQAGFRARRSPIVLGIAALAAVVFLVSPLWDHRDVWLLRESYVLVGLFLLAVLARPSPTTLNGGASRRLSSPNALRPTPRSW